MNIPPTIHYNPRGCEATYDPAADVCKVIVRGLETPDGKILQRGGPAHANDKAVMAFTIETSCAKLAGVDASARNLACGSTVRDIFHDTLLDRRDLLGSPVFRHKPADANEKRLFASAYDAAQKVRASSTVLGVNSLFFSSSPSLFATVDCFARDKAGAFWLMLCVTNPDSQTTFGQSLPLAAYVLEAGGYVPANATVRLGVWALLAFGPRFTEIPNDRSAARDIVISHLESTPF